MHANAPARERAAGGDGAASAGAADAAPPAPLGAAQANAPARERMEWADAAKGIAVFLVILGHLQGYACTDAVDTAIYAFHMPFFFMVAGFFLCRNGRKPRGAYICDKAYRLLAPAYLLLIVSQVWFDPATLEGGGVAAYLRLFFFVDGRMPFNSPCWFFIVLFEILAAERLANIAGRRTCVVCLACAALFLAGYAVHETGVWLPFGFEKALVAFGFMLAGHLARRAFDSCRAACGDGGQAGCDAGRARSGRSGQTGASAALAGTGRDLPWLSRILATGPLAYGPVRIGAVLAMSLAGYVVFGLVLNVKVSMYMFELHRYWCFVASGICGSVCLSTLCLLLEQRFHLRLGYPKWLCANSVFIIASHYLLLKPIKMSFSALHVSGTVGLTCLLPFIVLLITAVYVPICYIVNKHLPVLNGRHRSPKAPSRS